MILIQVGGIIFISVPDRIPGSGNIEPQSYGIDFLSQGIPPFPYTVNLKDLKCDPESGLINNHRNVAGPFQYSGGPSHRTGSKPFKHRSPIDLNLFYIERININGFCLFGIRNFGSVDLQQVTGENRLIVKVKKTEDTVGHLGDEITAVLANQQGNTFTLESQSEIGSSVSTVLRDKAIEAIVISLLGVLLYLAVRFDFSFGLAAAAATFHDVLVVLGICWILDVEVNLLLVTALLTLAGYSLNDSVVVFDRIRENLGHFHEKDFNEIINISINDVLGRSVVTSLTTSLVLAALFFFGGSAIHDFSFALLIGVIVGTYSSVFIASPLLTLKKR
ncbi:MAG: protein translocase subunit SecF [Candidatus Electrothrix sp. LOE2]|nr:protein translocase subunit SecF [Candidatus Electrothrix sp. LOE2]